MTGASRAGTRPARRFKVACTFVCDRISSAAYGAFKTRRHIVPIDLVVPQSAMVPMSWVVPFEPIEDRIQTDAFDGHALFESQSSDAVLARTCVREGYDPRASDERPLKCPAHGSASVPGILRCLTTVVVVEYAQFPASAKARDEVGSKSAAQSREPRAEEEV